MTKHFLFLLSLLSSTASYTQFAKSNEKVFKSISKANIARIPVKQLNLRDQELFYLNDSIKLLKHLTFLNLMNNHFDEWDSEIEKLTKLEILNYYGNNLTYIPESIKKLKRLKKLEISKNKIKKLPVAIGKLKKTEILVRSDE
jgi:Leucine-rich repeat (LRR) protein